MERFNLLVHLYILLELWYYEILRSDRTYLGAQELKVDP